MQNKFSVAIKIIGVIAILAGVITFLFLQAMITCCREQFILFLVLQVDYLLRDSAR